jgi:hypothetical protein
MLRLMTSNSWACALSFELAVLASQRVLALSEGFVFGL